MWMVARQNNIEAVKNLRQSYEDIRQDIALKMLKNRIDDESERREKVDREIVEQLGRLQTQTSGKENLVAEVKGMIEILTNRQNSLGIETSQIKDMLSSKIHALELKLTDYPSKVEAFETADQICTQHTKILRDAHDEHVTTTAGAIQGLRQTIEAETERAKLEEQALQTEIATVATSQEGIQEELVRFIETLAKVQQTLATLGLGDMADGDVTDGQNPNSGTSSDNL